MSRRASRGGSSAAASKRPKKVKTKRCLLALVNSALANENSKREFEQAKELVDWIITRKIFAKSDDLVALGRFPKVNCDCDTIVDFVSDSFSEASWDVLKQLEGFALTGSYLNLVQMLREAMDFIAQSQSGAYFEEVTILVAGVSADQLASVNPKYIKEMANQIQNASVSLFFVGTDLKDLPPTASQATQVLDILKSRCTITVDDFATALSKVSHFVQKPKAPRGQPFDLQLGSDFSLKVQMFIKNSEEKIAYDTGSVVRIREYEAMGPDVKPEPADEGPSAVADGGGDEPPLREVTKDKVIKGYHYGSSIIPFSFADKEDASIVKTGKQLQLIQFTPRKNILPQMLLSACRYFLPKSGDSGSETGMKALVQAMINLDSVAIVRYAYNINSNPRLSVLIPKMSKSSGCPVLMHYTLPFNEDNRNFDFQPLSSLGAEPDDLQIDAMNAYIDGLMLTTSVKGSDTIIERCRPREVRNPQLQIVCFETKNKALGKDRVTPEQKASVLAGVEPPADILADRDEAVDWLVKHFALETVSASRQGEEAGLEGGMSWREAKGLDPDAEPKWEDLP